MQISIQEALALAVVLLNTYCFGWTLIPADACKAYHRAQQPPIQAFMVAPMVVAFVLQIWLAFRVPAGIDRLRASVMVVASAVRAVSTAVL